MTDMQARFAKWFRKDAGACEFANMLYDAAQEWDDMEDEGKCRHNALFSWLAFGKEYTPFFAANSAIMRPAMLGMYLQWRAATVLEKGDKSDVEKAYMLRAGLYGVWHVMAWIIGGDDWAGEVGPEIYRTYGETMADLMKEFGHA